MGMNAQLHLVLDSESLETLKEEAERHHISISELCRKKLFPDPHLERIERLLQEIQKEVARRR
jgi:hypothetical protein